jgi:hypothetical protein
MEGNAARSPDVSRLPSTYCGKALAPKSGCSQSRPSYTRLSPVPSLACPIASLCNRPARSLGKSFGSRGPVGFDGGKYEATLLLELIEECLYQASQMPKRF